jgi:hypothetical protein
MSLSITGVDRLLLVAALVSASGSAFAQTAAPGPDPLEPVRSMGKPPVWKPFLGGYYGLDRSGEENSSGGGASSASTRTCCRRS